MPHMILWDNHILTTAQHPYLQSSSAGCGAHDWAANVMAQVE